MSMVGFGSVLYYFYNLSLAAGTDKTQHPYKEWTYEAYLMVGAYGQFTVLWFVNLIIGHNGNILDKLVVWDLNLMLIAPVATLLGAFYTSSNYGSIAEVALGTEWAMTIADDPHYSVLFNSAILISVLNLIFEVTARPSIAALYQQKLTEKAKKAADE